MTKSRNKVAVPGLTLGLITPLAVMSAIAPTSTVPAPAMHTAAAVSTTWWGWGLNSVGELGDGSTVNRTNPVLTGVPSGTTFTALAGGGYHALALDSAGQAWAWGGNGHGELGNGGTADSLTPVRVSMPSGVTFTAVAGGGYQSIALDTEGRVWAWGINVWGEVGDGTGVNRRTPVRVALPAGVRVTAISAGQHGLALDSTGQAWSWGLNHTGGALGDGTTYDRYSPVRVVMPSGVRFTAIDAGAAHSVAIDTDGRAWSWGCNDHGQLGDGTTANRTVPVLVSAPATVRFRTLAGGNWASWGLDSTGTVWSWGSNGGRDLGDGTTIDRYSPVRLDAPVGVAFTALAGGGHHGLATDTAGQVWAWGYNANGQVGDGTTINRSSPVRVATPAGVRFQTVFAGGRHSLAIGVPAAASTTVTDQDPPAITNPGDQTAVATGPSGTVVTWTASPSATDAVDGTVPVICNHQSGESYPPGPTTVTCQATDRSGNTATASFDVRVLYRWEGFRTPLVAPGHQSSPNFTVFNAGAMIPVRFAASYADGTAAVFVPSPVWYEPQKCGPLSLPLDTTRCGAPAATAARSTLNGGTWNYTWKTSRGQAGSYWKITIRLADGSVHDAIVALS